MSASVQITLDVTPPTPVWGTPYRTGELRAIIPYIIDGDGHVESAEVNGQSALVEPASVLTAQSYPEPGMLDIGSLVVDDVGNSRLVSDLVWLGPVVRPPESISATFSDVRAVHVAIGDRSLSRSGDRRAAITILRDRRWSE